MRQGAILRFFRASIQPKSTARKRLGAALISRGAVAIVLDLVAAPLDFLAQLVGGAEVLRLASGGAIVDQLLYVRFDRAGMRRLAMLPQVETQHRVEREQSRPCAKILAPVCFRDQFQSDSQRLRRIQIVVDGLVKALVVLRRPSRRLDTVGSRVVGHAARELAEIIEIVLRRADRIVVERNLGSVLRTKTKNPKCQRIDSRRSEIAQQRELACALADLGALFANQKRVVHEVPRERLVRRAFRLRNLVLMMHRDVIDAAGVDVDNLAEILHGHRGALDMPSRITASPRTVPLHQMIRLTEHPQREIVRAMLIRRMLEALRGVLLVETLAREPAETILAAVPLDVEVHAAPGDVRYARVDDSRRKRDHVADMIGRT